MVGFVAAVATSPLQLFFVDSSGTKTAGYSSNKPIIRIFRGQPPSACPCRCGFKGFRTPLQSAHGPRAVPAFAVRCPHGTPGYGRSANPNTPECGRPVVRPGISPGCLFEFANAVVEPRINEHTESRLTGFRTYLDALGKSRHPSMSYTNPILN